MNRSILLLFFASTLLLSPPCSHAAGKDPLTPTFPIPGYTTSWLGNSFGGPTWIQRYSSEMYTRPDGTCYMITGWDEGGRECGIYKDGKVVGSGEQSHGWGYTGGASVTANSKYLFFGQTMYHLGGADESGETWPPTGIAWYGVGRRKLDGSPAPFPGGKGHGCSPALGGNFLTVNVLPRQEKRKDVSGLAASESQLFMANPQTGEIEVYEPDTMKKTGSWPLPRAGHMAYEPKTNSLWIIQGGEGTAAAAIRHYTTEGKVAGPDLSLPAGTIPAALSVSPKGDLLVGDIGPAQQVLIYGNLGGTPKLTRTFGDKGGIYSGIPGKVGPLKFSSPSGVGMDADGNVYVASDMGGTMLESYTPEGKRNWEVHGLEFVECADIDRASPNDAYTNFHHYALDHTKPSGKDSEYVGYLVGKFKYPNDPRLNGWGVGSMFVRNIQGKRFLYGTDMNASVLQIYRFTGEGELTALAGIIENNVRSLALRPNPKNHPEKGGYIWRDVSGNGNFDAAEYDLNPDVVPTTAWSVDSRGDVWNGYRIYQGPIYTSFIRRIPCEGLDEKGNPIYRFKSAVVVPAPAPFNDPPHGSLIERMQYVAETDTMYLSGFTPDHKDEHRDWKTSGPVICRYDQWSTKPSKRWEIVVPFESIQVPGSKAMCPDAISVAGDRLFNGYCKDGEIRVYDIADGGYLGSLLAGPEVDKTSGWIDTMYGVQASQRSNGDYLIFAEEVWHEKVLMYHLKSK